MAAPFLRSTSARTRQQLRAKRFSLVTRGVYVEGGDPDELWTRVRAALLVHPKAVACGVTAAVLQRLPVDDDGLIHLCRGQLAARSERADWRTHRYDIADDEVMQVRGVRMTNGPRTWSDLAAVADLDELVALGDVVVRRFGQAAMAEAVTRSWGRAGVVNLREALPLLHPGADSPAESRARLRLHRAGFTSLVPGVIISDQGGGWLAAPDLGDPVARVAVQHDGLVHLQGDAKQRRHDLDRDELSRLEGWQVVVSTATDDHHPDRLIARVGAAYRRAAQVWGTDVLPEHLSAA